MPSWSEVFRQIGEGAASGDQNAPNTVRHKYLKELFNYTGRNVIAYYSGWLSKPGIQLLGINDEDMNGFMMAVHGLDKQKGLDLFCTRPAGVLRRQNLS